MKLTDDVNAKGFQQKFGVPLTAKFRHMPESFARLLAKIGYCNLLTVVDPGDFQPICLPYIMGDRKNPSYVVGGTFEIADPVASPAARAPTLTASPPSTTAPAA